MFLHIDINSYFATILQQENPTLRGKPVGVVKSKGRTCIIAASKEAKKYGVKTGCSLREARLLVAKLIVVPAEFDMYLHCTRKLKEVFESVSPEAEIFSLDEAFICLNNYKYIYPDPRLLAINIQRKIRQNLGEWVTCNIGIAENRLLAKTASEISPKGSVCQVLEDGEKIPEASGILFMRRSDLLENAEFKDVCGIGSRLERRLGAFGIKHPAQINSLSDKVLNEYFGPFLSKELRLIGRGEGSYILDRSDDTIYMKSVGRTITGYKLCNDEVVIKRVLYNLMEEATYKARKMNMAGRYVSVFLEGEDKGWSSHLTCKHYIRHTNEMFKLLYNNLYRKWKRNFKVIRYGVLLGMLKPLKEVPMTLFPEWYKYEALYKAIDAISDKYGLFSLHSGILTSKEIIRPEVTGYLGDKNFVFRKDQ